MKQTLIIIGAPTKGNFDRAKAVAGALGLIWNSESDSHLSFQYPRRDDVYVRWSGTRFIAHNNYDHFERNVRKVMDSIIDLRPFADDALKVVKLNAEYTATIDGDEVVVGCQRFPASKVLELAKMIEGK